MALDATQKRKSIAQHVLCGGCSDQVRGFVPQAGAAMVHGGGRQGLPSGFHPVIWLQGHNPLSADINAVVCGGLDFLIIMNRERLPALALCDVQ